MRSLLFILIFLFSSLFFASSGLADSRLQLIDPWVRQAPPTSKNLAGYGELKNTSGSAIKIVSIKSTLFENIEMHVTTFEKGMMRMA
ncbi:MAG: copper chaperone PCu(A)C, partial [Gammaproteobacteria bacterium]|nr:copper chaperone PCu(A)C [Gammaproteobacteria bacterium]